MVDADGAVAEGGEGRRVAALGEGGATGVDEELRGALGMVGVGDLLKALEMGVAVEDGVVAGCGEVLGIEDVAVRQEVTARLIALGGGVYEDGVGAEEVEVEEHLVDLGVAVAADGDDLVCAGVETLHDGGGVDALGDAVARTVVEDVAEDDELVEALTVVVGEDLVEGWQAAVDVGDDEVFHIWSSKKVFPVSVAPT